MLEIKKIQSWSEESGERWLTVFLVSFFVLFYGASIWGGDYLYSDDYYIRQMVITGKLHWFENLFTQMGRPIFGFFNNIIFRGLNEISDYSWVRAFGLLGTLACVLKIKSLGKQFQWPTGYVLLFILGTLASPGWAVYVGWTMCAAFPWAGYLALCAGSLALPRDGQYPRVIFVVLALILGLLSIFIYQITVGLVLVPFLFWLRQNGSFRRRVVTAITVYGIMGISNLGNLFFVRIAKATLFAEADDRLNRDGLVLDIGERLGVLYDKVFPLLVDQWMAYSSRVWIYVGEGILMVGLLLGLILVLIGRESIKASALRFLFFLPSVLLVAAPFLLLKEGLFPLRMFPVLTGIICMGYLLILPLEVKPGVRLVQKAFALFMGLWIVFQVGFGAYVFREGLVAPNVREVIVWKDQLSKQFDTRPDFFIYYEPINKNDGFSPLPYLHEYGHASASYVWIAQHAINTYLDELFPEAAKGKTGNYSFPDFASKYAANCSPSIYGWKIATPEHPPVYTDGYSYMHPLLGTLMDMRNGWRGSWFGVFNLTYWPWIQHIDYGWLWLDVEHSSADQLVFQQKGGNLFFLKRDSYPMVYWKQGDQMLEPCEVANMAKK